MAIELSESNISEIITAISTLGGVVLGTFVSHFLSSIGGIKLHMRNFEYDFHRFEAGVSKSIESMSDATTISIIFVLDFYNNSRVIKSLRDLKIVNTSGDIDEIKDVATCKNRGHGFFYENIETITAAPGENVSVKCKVLLDRSFFGDKMNENVYLRYTKCDTNRNKKIKLLIDKNKSVGLS